MRSQPRHPPASSSYLASARHHGITRLYKGAFRTAATGISVGAVTFGVYDAAMRVLVETLERRRLRTK